jgi:hypothetical protein
MGFDPVQQNDVFSSEAVGILKLSASHAGCIE